MNIHTITPGAPRRWESQGVQLVIRSHAALRLPGVYYGIRRAFSLNPPDAATDGHRSMEK